MKNKPFIKLLKSCILDSDKGVMNRIHDHVTRNEDTYTLLAAKEFLLAVPNTGYAGKPLVSAHIDTVRKEGKIVLYETDSGIIGAKKSVLGGDDRCGVAIALSLIDRKADCVIAFFDGEESGCIGSSCLLRSNPEILRGVNCYIGLDRRGTNDMAVYNYTSKEFMKLFEAHGYKKVGGTITDVGKLEASFPKACVNLSVGFFSEHTTKETVNPHVTYKVAKILPRIIEQLADKKFDDLESYDKWGYRSTSMYSYGGYGSYGSSRRYTSYSNYDDDDDYYYDKYVRGHHTEGTKEPQKLISVLEDDVEDYDTDDTEWYEKTNFTYGGDDLDLETQEQILDTCHGCTELYEDEYAKNRYPGVKCMTCARGWECLFYDDEDKTPKEQKLSVPDLKTSNGNPLPEIFCNRTAQEKCYACRNRVFHKGEGGKQPYYTCKHDWICLFTEKDTKNHVSKFKQRYVFKNGKELPDSKVDMAEMVCVNCKHYSKTRCSCDKDWACLFAKVPIVDVAKCKRPYMYNNDGETLHKLKYLEGTELTDAETALVYATVYDKCLNCQFRLPDYTTNERRCLYDWACSMKNLDVYEPQYGNMINAKRTLSFELCHNCPHKHVKRGCYDEETRCDKKFACLDADNPREEAEKNNIKLEKRTKHIVNPVYADGNPLSPEDDNMAQKVCPVCMLKMYDKTTNTTTCDKNWMCATSAASYEAQREAK